MKTLLVTALTLAPIAYFVVPNVIEPLLEAVLPLTPVFVVVYAIALIFKDAVRFIGKLVNTRLKKMQIYIKRKYRKFIQFVKA